MSDEATTYEIVRLQDIHLASAMMACGIQLQGCEVSAGGWATFVLLVADDKQDVRKRLAAVDCHSPSSTEDVAMEYGQYRRALNELRAILRSTKGAGQHESGRPVAG